MFTKTSEMYIMAGMDDLDIKLIQQLQEDATLSSDELGKLLFASPGTVRRRILQLKMMDAIRIIAVVDPEKVGETLTVMIALDANKHYLDAVAEELSGHPQVKWVMKTEGRHNVVLGARFSCMNDFSRFRQESIEGNEHIYEYETLVTLEPINKHGHFAKVQLTSK